MDRVAKINLKTDTKFRDKLFSFCLGDPTNRKLAIGWSCVYNDGENLDNYEEYYQRIRSWIDDNNRNKAIDEKKIRWNCVHDLFREAKSIELFWTRDNSNHYWICKICENARPFFDKELDIGAILPVEAYDCGVEVPGQIQASFTQPGTASSIRNRTAVEYSKHIFNKCSGRKEYELNLTDLGNVIRNLPPLELEELVIAYIQVKYDYYVLSNSIARKSTTPLIECVFSSRNPKNPSKAVVQVKAAGSEIDASKYKRFDEEGYHIFLYSTNIKDAESICNLTVITEEELLDFYYNYQAVLPEEILQYECIFD